MKATLEELDGGFWITFEPETMQEQVDLVRFGLNATKERVWFETYATKDYIGTQVSLSRRRKPVSRVKP